MPTPSRAPSSAPPSATPPSRRGRLPRRSQLKLALLVALPILGIILYFQLPWEHTYREQAVTVMTTELARLPSVGNAPELSHFQESDSTSPFAWVDFPQSVSCVEVQAHYRQATMQAGWISGGGRIDLPELQQSYHKVVGSYYLVLLVECAEGTATSAPSAEASYDLDIKVPLPYSLRLIGPWWPKG